MDQNNLIRNKDIVCFSMSDWDTEMVSNRFQIMSRFAKNNRIFFFEKPFNPLSYIYSFFKGGTLYDDNRGSLKKALRIVKKSSEKFYTVTPFSIDLPPIDSFFVSILNKTILNPSYIIFLYYFLIKSLFKIRSPILWFYDFRLKLLLKVHHRLSCYHVTEDYRGMGKALWGDISGKDLATSEDDFVKKVDMVFAVSEHLCNVHKVNNKNTFCIINGVDFKRYNSASYKERNRSIILGYIGNISSKVDLDLALKVSNEFKSAMIVLVGPIRKLDNIKLAMLMRRKNLVFLGRRNIQELPCILSTFSVCLIPFITEEWFVKSAQPLKLFEYMASGKPVVSTYMNCLDDLPDGCVYVSKSHKEFLENIHKALNEKSADLMQKRIELASQYDWDIQFNKINHKINEEIQYRQ